MKTKFIPVVEGRYYTISDVAKALGLHAPTLWRRIMQQRIFPAPSVKIGFRFYYPEAEFLRLTQPQETATL